MKIGIIIPCRGHPDLTIDCINSLKCSKFQDFRFYIANNDPDNDDRKQLINYLKTLSPHQIKYIQYNWYRFGKLNNDVVKNHLDSDVTHILFCNNDIKCIDDCLYNISEFIKQNPNEKIGTAGCKLLYEDNTIQHAGMELFVRDYGNNDRRFFVTHRGLRKPKNQFSHIDYVIGNTCGFCLISRELFETVGMFNENYIECFEDVEMNIKCLLNGYKNVYLGNTVAIHYESVARDLDQQKENKMRYDYNETLKPFILDNFEFLDKLKL